MLIIVTAKVHPAGIEGYLNCVQYLLFHEIDVDYRMGCISVHSQMTCATNDPFSSQRHTETLTWMLELVMEQDSEATPYLLAQSGRQALH